MGLKDKQASNLFTGNLRSDQYSEDFGIFHSPGYGGLYYLRRRQVVFLLAASVNGIILDIGCKDARFCSELLQRGGGCYVGIDIDKQALDLDKIAHRDEAAHFLLGDATRLPFPDETFDFVLITEVVEHIENEQQVISEVARVLKKGGNCILSVPTLDLYTFIHYFIASKLGILPNDKLLYQDPDHRREYCKYNFDKRFTSLAKFKSVLQDSGLTITAQRPAYVIVSPLEHLWRRVIKQPHRHVHLAKLLIRIDNTLSNLLKSFGHYTVFTLKKPV